MAHVIVDEGLHDVEYIKEQTDLSFLVRDDNGRFLRECDVVEGGADDQFYFWNAAKGRKQLATGTWGSEVMTIALDEETDPALEGTHKVRLRGRQAGPGASGLRAAARPSRRVHAGAGRGDHRRAGEEHPRGGAGDGGGQVVDDLRLLGRLQALPLGSVPARDGLPDGADRQLRREAGLGHQGVHLVADAGLRPDSGWASELQTEPRMDSPDGAPPDAGHLQADVRADEARGCGPRR